MDTKRVFREGTIARIEAAVTAYREAYTKVPAVVIVNTADADPRADYMNIAGCTILRSDLVNRGEVRVCGFADNGVASIG